MTLWHYRDTMIKIHTEFWKACTEGTAAWNLWWTVVSRGPYTHITGGGAKPVLGYLRNLVRAGQEQIAGSHHSQDRRQGVRPEASRPVRLGWGRWCWVSGEKRPRLSPASFTAPLHPPPLYETELSSCLGLMYSGREPLVRETTCKYSLIPSIGFSLCWFFEDS